MDDAHSIGCSALDLIVFGIQFSVAVSRSPLFNFGIHNLSFERKTNKTVNEEEILNNKQIYKVSLSIAFNVPLLSVANKTELWIIN